MSEITPPPVNTNSLNTQQVGNLVRYWVHYDTQIAALNRQLRKLREERQMTESQILTSFQAAHIPNPVIQIAGGRLVIGQERHTQPLTFKLLESLLHQYYRQKIGLKDETDSILKFIKEQREVITTPSLKRVVMPPQQQPQMQ
jgi:hypothetical protein